MGNEISTYTTLYNFPLRATRPACVYLTMQAASRGNVPGLIRKMFGSNHGQDTNYSDWGFSWPFSEPPRKCRRNTLKQAATASFHIPFQFIILIIFMTHEAMGATNSVIK